MSTYMNLNENSTCHRQICLSACDNHGRCGYGVLNKEIKLDEVLDKIKQYQNNDD